MGFEGVMLSVPCCSALLRLLLHLDGTGYFPVPESAGVATFMFAAAGSESRRDFWHLVGAGIVSEAV